MCFEVWVWYDEVVCMICLYQVGVNCLGLIGVRSIKGVRSLKLLLNCWVVMHLIVSEVWEMVMWLVVIRLIASCVMLSLSVRIGMTFIRIYLTMIGLIGLTQIGVVIGLKGKKSNGVW